MNTPELEALIKGCQCDDRRSQNALYNTYYPKFIRIAKKYSRDPLIINELMNDGFLKVFQCVKDYKHLGSFEGWMRIVIANAIINRVRTRNYNKPDYIIIGGSEDIEYIHREVISNDFEFQNLKETIDITIEMLPKASKKIMKLAAVGYKYREIADMLSINEGTVKWHVSTARQKMNILIGENIK